MNTLAEENYLKAIYSLSWEDTTGVTTNSIAGRLNTKASSVSDMLKKLKDKKLINYQKYKGVSLTAAGRKVALKIIRKHRLWELFLVEHLDFKWDEVHDIAEQLEHVVSPELVNRLDKFMNHPKYDPHGDPIPDQNGNLRIRNEISLAELEEKEEGVIVGVKDSSPNFLQFLESIKLLLGSEIKLVERIDFDQSIHIVLNGDKQLTLSRKVAQNLSVSKK